MGWKYTLRQVNGEPKYTFLSVNINYTRTPCYGNNSCSCHNLILRRSSAGWNGQIRTWTKFHGQHFELGISNSLPTLIVLVHKRRITMPWWHDRYGGIFESGFLLQYFNGYPICTNSLFLNCISSHNPSNHDAITAQHQSGHIWSHWLMRYWSKRYTLENMSVQTHMLEVPQFRNIPLNMPYFTTEALLAQPIQWFEV